ncbi:hypothetical protein BKA70DRAFT_1229802 [Coprinopsis sp. MPI-PUGE-AT-0042]|nr:hypothetical protein BKA70DRAFT_1229802 [Coprinopsis sp. MPI-PUGE-AT-0042]
MSFLSNSVSTFIVYLATGPGSHYAMTDDILALVVLFKFSAPCYLKDTIARLDHYVRGFFQLLLILSDQAMIQGCYINPRRPWSYLFPAISVLRTFLVPIFLRQPVAGIITIYIFTFIALITSVTLVVVTAYRNGSLLELKELHTSRNDPLAQEQVRFIRFIVKSTISITLAGVLHIGLFASTPSISVALNVLFVSLTKIALHVLDHTEFYGDPSERPIALHISPNDEKPHRGES